MVRGAPTGVHANVVPTPGSGFAARFDPVGGTAMPEHDTVATVATPATMLNPIA
jgi:hypothetical protein